LKKQRLDETESRPTEPKELGTLKIKKLNTFPLLEWRGIDQWPSLVDDDKDWKDILTSLGRLDSWRGPQHWVEEMFHGAGDCLKEESFVERMKARVREELGEGGSQDHSIFETITIDPKELKSHREVQIVLWDMELYLRKTIEWLVRGRGGSLGNPFPFARWSRRDGVWLCCKRLKRLDNLISNSFQELKSKMGCELDWLFRSIRTDHQPMDEWQQRAKWEQSRDGCGKGIHIVGFHGIDLTVKSDSIHERLQIHNREFREVERDEDEVTEQANGSSQESRGDVWGKAT
jgi:hypothetical protein